MDNILLLQSSLDYLKGQATRVLSQHISSAKNLAQEVDDPIEFLQSFDWRNVISDDQFASPPQIREWNLNFDLRGCFGQVALAILLVENYFPHNEIEVGEVLENGFARRMLEKLHKETDSEKRIEIAKKLLMYEEPRMIIVIKGRQFDPVSALVGHITHHRVVKHNVWPTLMAYQMVDLSLETDNLDDRRDHLHKSEVFCPGMMLVKENLMITNMVVDPFATSSLAALEDLMSLRPSARLFYRLWLEYGRVDIFNKYPKEVFDLLQSEYNNILKQEEELCQRRILA